MGTLDDAIREHLELKRRAGASADEVRQLESEALGPARRDAAPAEAPEAAAEPAVAEPEPEAPAPAPEREPEPEPTPAPVADTAAPDVPRAEPDAEWLDEDPFGDAGPEPKTTGNPPSDYVAPDDEGEDLLEETPDFLQETPDHDKLWFEQKPPRDFDFDN